jgi:hypothetical protein
VSLALATLMTMASPEPVRVKGGPAKEQKGAPTEASEEEDSAEEASGDTNGGDPVE